MLQYQEEKSQIKDAVKLAKISLSTTWTVEDFKSALSEHISSPPVSDSNLKVGNSAPIAVRPQPPNCDIWLAFIAASNTFIVLGVKGGFKDIPSLKKLVFEELLERAKEKEEKEAKKRKRLADDFFHLLYSIKDITESSKWEDFRPLIEDSQEF
ncbi:pre-mRNA-processing protein 40A-like, partial [Trifolium medium]|nr:pre-mRNA-processing protein 40A-like [Trifolium medium]